MFVRPAPGLSIRDPDLMDLLPEEGREVPDSTYWIRRLRDGDVVSGPVKTGQEQKKTSDRSTKQ
jgi:hypothetical protein